MKYEWLRDDETAEKEMVRATKKRDDMMSKGGRLKQLRDEASKLKKDVSVSGSRLKY